MRVTSGDSHSVRCHVCALDPSNRQRFEDRLLRTPPKLRAKLASEFGLSVSSMYRHRSWLLAHVRNGRDMGLTPELVGLALSEMPGDIEAATRSAVGRWRQRFARGEGPLALEVFAEPVALTVAKETGTYRNVLGELLAGDVPPGDIRFVTARGVLAHVLRGKARKTYRTQALDALDQLHAAVSDLYQPEAVNNGS